MSSARGRTALRFVGIAIAVGLSVCAVGMIVFGTETKTVRLGLLAGAWGLVFGGFSVYGPRRSHPSEAYHEDEPGSELEVRRHYELELERERAGRREYELQLEVMLRRELEKGLRAELVSLRHEVAGLRSDVQDAVDGRMRLERIETRIVGSNIAELQEEVRRRSGSQETLASLVAAPPQPSPLRTPEPAAAAAQPAADPAASPAAPRTERPGPQRPAPPQSPIPADATQPMPAVVLPDGPQVPVVERRPEPAAAAEQPVPAAAAEQPAPPAVEQPVPPPADPPRTTLAADPFAGLPRLTPVDDLDLLADQPPAAPPPAAQAPTPAPQAPVPGPAAEPSRPVHRPAAQTDIPAAPPRRLATSQPAAAAGSRHLGQPVGIGATRRFAAEPEGRHETGQPVPRSPRAGSDDSYVGRRRRAGD